MLPMVCALGAITNKKMQAHKEIIKSTGIDFVYPFYASSSAELSQHQLVVVTSGALTFTSVVLM